MPVDFLSAEQERRYGRYTEPPTPAQLARYFHLDEADHDLIAKRRSDYNRLGFALQLCTVRFLGTFLTDLSQVPEVAVESVAAQLALAEPLTLLASYLQRDTTRREHASEIQKHFGYRDFGEQPEHFRIMRWLYLRAWFSAERPSVLFDLLTNRLVEQKILLPGVTTLTRVVVAVRDKVAARLWRLLARLPSAEQRTRLETLLKVPPEERLSTFDRLRRAPTRVSAQGLVGALERLESIRAIGLAQLEPQLRPIPPSRIKALARYATAARAAHIDRMPYDRKLATLVAFIYNLEAVAQDDALDLLHLLTLQLLGKADKKGERERLRTLKDLDEAALKLHEACMLLLDYECSDAELRPKIFERVPKEQLREAVEVVATLAQPEDSRTYYKNLLTHYSSIRQFLPNLLTTVEFKGNAAGKPVLDALTFLKELEEKHKSKNSKAMLKPAPREVINKAWQHYVLQGQHQVTDRRYYTFCVLERLQDSLAHRNVFVAPSEKWADPRAKLVQGEVWEKMRPQIATILNRSLKAEDALSELAQELDEAYQRVAENLPTNADCRIEQEDGQDTLVLNNLDKLDEPASLTLLKAQVTALLPEVDLTELILEVDSWTGFSREFTHISEANTRVEDLSLSVCAVLLAEACNIGLEPVLDRQNPALRRERLAYLQQNYIRAETLTRANAKLVDAQANIKLAQKWGKMSEAAFWGHIG